MHKSILVTGANGQLGKELQALVTSGYVDMPKAEFYFEDRNSLDITDENILKEYINRHHIDTLINCAAYTAVDKAENHKDMAYAVNRDAVEVLARLSKENNIFLIHMSTDYVFGGDHFIPLPEDEKTNPHGVYAKSKLAGEEVIASLSPKRAIIIRTSWIYSESGHNFLHTMLRLGKSKDEIGVVCDQIGTPTDAKDLAIAILDILIKENESPTVGVEIYHYSNEGSCSWYDFAQAIFELSDTACQAKPIYTDEYATLATRPHYSVLNKKKIKNKYGIKIPYWRDSLELCIKRLKEDKPKIYRIGIIGSGFIASGLAQQLMHNPAYTVSGILTRSDIFKRDDFFNKALFTYSLDDLINTSDLIVECTGDAIYATDTIDKIVKAKIPVVTMNSEFHVTTGSYFVNRGYVTEAEGDQPGVQAILHEEAIAMGFKPLAYVNIKGFLNENPPKEDMEYWGAKSNLSLEMVTSFTDGTKVSIEQVLVANGLGAKIIQDGLVKLKSDDMLEGGSIYAKKAKELGAPVSDYVISATLPAGVFLVAEHDYEQAGALKYYKLGEGPYYVIERTYHLCHLEIVKTIKRVLDGGPKLLDNSDSPKYSVAAVAKHDLKAGYTIHKGIGSFDVRGTAVSIEDHKSHVPIGILANATLKKDIKEGEIIHFDDVELPQSLALNIWKEIIS